MKYVKARSKKRIDFAKLREISPAQLDKSLIDKVKRKVGLEGITKILNSNQGAKNTSQKLHNKVSVQDVANIKKMLDEDVFDVKSKFNRFKFFFPYRGVWFFDIIVNRKLKENEEDNLVKYYGVFLHGNSGYVRAYEVDNRTQSHLTDIFNQFLQDNREDDYPVKKIISDNEGGVPNSLDGVEIVKKTQSNTSHGTLSRINSFASALRNYNHNEYPNKQYITLDVLDEYIEIWNQHQIPFVNCTREDMMDDVDLEEAYIAACMTENADVKKAVEEGFKADDLVKIKETNDKYKGDKRTMNKELGGTYKIVENKDGNIVLQNINDPKDIRTTRAMNITKRVRSNKAQLDEYLAETNQTLPVVNDKAPQVVVRLNRTPAQQEENKEVARIHKEAKTVNGARENISLRRGQKSMDYEEQAKKKNIDLRKLSQKERTELIKKYVDEELKNDFDLGFLSYYTDEEKYARMEEFVKKLPQEYHDQLFGNIRFFDVPKKALGYNKYVALSNNLAQLAEHPEFRAIWNNATATADDNEIINALGYFAKNKSGPKQK